MAINLKTAFASQIDERFKQKAFGLNAFASKFDAEFIGNKTVKIYSILTSSLKDYNPAGGYNRYGDLEELQDTVQELTLTQQKALNYSIDGVYNSQQGFLKKVPESLAMHLDEVVIPAYDKYVFGVIGNGADVNHIKVLTLTDSNVYGEILTAQEALTDANVPEQGRVLYASAATINLLKQSSKFVLASEIAMGNIRLSGMVGYVDGLPIVQVPKATLGVGVQFILLHDSCVVAPVTISNLQMHNNPMGVYGSVIQGVFVYDAFILANKQKAIYVSQAVGDKTALAAELVIVKAISLTPYTTATADVVTAAITAAEAVAANAKATQSQVNKALADLVAAKDGLIAK